MPEALGPGRAVERGRLVQLGVDPLQRRHEDDDRVADLQPDQHDHHGVQRDRGVAEPVGRVLHAEAGQDRVERPGAGLEDPAPQHARDGDRQDLRQVVGRAQERGCLRAERAPDVVEQHGGEQKSDEGGDDRDREDRRDRVPERAPEQVVAHQLGVVGEPHPGHGRRSALPLVQAHPDVDDERNSDDGDEPDAHRHQVPPVGAVALTPAPGSRSGRRPLCDRRSGHDGVG